MQFAEAGAEARFVDGEVVFGGFAFADFFLGFKGKGGDFLAFGVAAAGEFFGAV